jgi:hypothetical protein
MVLLLFCFKQTVAVIVPFPSTSVSGALFEVRNKYLKLATKPQLPSHSGLHPRDRSSPEDRDIPWVHTLKNILKIHYKQLKEV